MHKLSKTLTGSSLAMVLTVFSAGLAAAQETPVPETPVVEEQTSVVAELAGVSGAEGSGEATLSARAGGQTEARLEVAGLPAGSEWSAFLVAGSCEEPGPAISSLGAIEVGDQGTGEGGVAITAELAALTAVPATVQIHPQGEAPTTAVLCGALGSSDEAPAPAPAF